MIIRYAPSALVLILSLFVTFLLSYNHNINLQENLKVIQKEKISNNKERIKTSVNTINEYLTNEQEKANETVKKEIRRQVHVLYQVMYSIYNKYKNIKSKEEIIEIIKTSLNYIRFDYSRAYFFINDLDGNTVFFPDNPSREGNNYIDFKDINGVYKNKISIELVKENIEGFVELNNKDEKFEEYQKISYVKKFEPYDWYIGVDEFIEDIKNITEYKILEDIRSIKLENQGDIFVLDKKGNVLASKDRIFDGENIFENKELSHISQGVKKFLSIKKIDKFIENGKIYYLKKSNSFDWIIGSSFNKEFIINDIHNIQKDLNKEYREDIYTLILTSIFLTILLLFISFLISRKIEKRFLDYENDLGNKNKKLRNAHDLAKIGEWELDLKSKKTYWSDKIIEIMGVKKDTWKNLKEIMLDEDWKYYEDSINKCIETKEEHLCEYRVKRLSDDKIIWVESKGRFTERSTIIGTIQDITERKEMEHEAKKREKLLYQQSKLATMGEMLNNIAHQWRQPLSIISTASSGMKVQKELDTLTDENFEKTIDAITESVQYLSQTIDDFRNFFKPSDNRFSDVSISFVVDKTLNLLDLKIKSEKIIVLKDITEIEVISLKNELVQVLINILNNAIDELVKIDTKRIILIKTYEKDDILFIEVFDSGKGIDNQIKDRIFEPYFTTKHQAQGTGIGLYMSHEIITKLLSGNIYVENDSFVHENQEYTGAKFTIELKI